MARVMIGCARNWNIEIFTGLEIPRKAGLRGLGEKVITCPRCGMPHFLRRLYFEGDDPGRQGNEALEVAHGFAAELGVLIGGMAIIEGYLPKLLSKHSAMGDKDAWTIMGTFPAYSQRVHLLENLSKNIPEGDARRKDMTIIVEKLRRAGGIRDKYAHAQYSVANETMHVIPFFGDARKKQQMEIMTTDDICADVETLKSIKDSVHGYLYRNERPKR